MNKHFCGKVWLMGDDIDTDIILPTEYLALPDIKDMLPYVFSPIRPDFYSKVHRGDILVAGKNFGCGSSREQAPEVLKELGLSAVIAKSFARIFYRNAMNNGLLLLENDKLYDDVLEGDYIEVFVGEKIMYRDRTYDLKSIPTNLLQILQKGGLVQAMKEITGGQGNV